MIADRSTDMAADNSADVILFGVRHLSPAGAWHLRHLLDSVAPQLVLIEGPCDMDPLLADLVRSETVPPVACLAYTSSPPGSASRSASGSTSGSTSMDSLLYPLAEYSPEYQAALWASHNKVPCRFMDLPSDVFLALHKKQEGSRAKGAGGADRADAQEEGRGDARGPDTEQGPSAPPDCTTTPKAAVPDDPDDPNALDGYETFWERVLEHAADVAGYHEGAMAFGAGLRLLDEQHDADLGAGHETDHGTAAQRCANEPDENALREAHMRRVIQAALDEGIPANKIVAVTGAWHVSGLRTARPMTDREFAALPRTPSSCTLMPYSYYRLSSRSGYGAGNKAPAYYGLLWQSLTGSRPWQYVHAYLAGIAACLREEGQVVAVADVIEAVRLASALADLRGSKLPALPDLRDAAMTCLGRGSLARVGRAMARMEVGDIVGSLPEGVSRTSLQEDFYRQLKGLKLERYQSQVSREVQLDLREKRTVKSEKSAFLDLSRSFFLHKLRVLGISFARNLPTDQANASWAESWEVSWTPETEIELVECALKGDTLDEAVTARFAERLTREGACAADLALVMEDAFSCGLAGEMIRATRALQAAAADSTGLADLATTLERLSRMLRYGDVRRLDLQPLEPLLAQIYLRCCLLVPDACTCDETGAAPVLAALEQINSAELAHDQLDTAFWLQPLERVALRDSGNARLSGLAAAILLERGAMTPATLGIEMSRRLSPGTPVEAGAGWFAGLAMRNRHALLARQSLWQALDNYVAGLDETNFRRALVFLRKAFADFSAADKDRIGENLGELWGLETGQVSEQVNASLDREAQTIVDDLAGFDFDDF